jgi:hypothetical protein
VPRTHNEKRTVSSINGIGETEYPNVKNEIGLLSHTMYKNQLKVGKKLKCKT